MVVKPPSETPLSALALAELATRAGLPPGVFNVVPTRRAREVGLELTQITLVLLFSFTGSTEICMQLLAQCATTVKKVSLELGGNAPFIVFDDADLDQAIEGALASKYRNMGQTCVCANRFLVQDGVYDAFEAKLAERVAKMKVGNGADAGVVQGPLINMEAIEKVERLLADAVAAGAKVVVGGHRHALGGTYFEPTVVTGVKPTMEISREEIFGPVATLTRFSDEVEAIRARQRYRLRSCRLFLRQRHRPHLPGRRGDGVRNGGGLRWLPLDRVRAVRLRQAVRHRPRGLEIRDRGLRRDQVRAAQRARRLSRRAPASERLDMRRTIIASLAASAIAATCQAAPLDATGQAMLGKAETCIKSQAPAAAAVSKSPNDAVSFILEGLCAVEVQRFETYQRNLATLAGWRATPVKPVIAVDPAHPSPLDKTMLDQAAQTTSDLAKVTIDPETGDMVMPPGFRAPMDTATMMNALYRGAEQRARFQAVAASAVLAAEQAAGGRH